MTSIRVAVALIGLLAERSPFAGVAKRLARVAVIEQAVAERVGSFARCERSNLAAVDRDGGSSVGGVDRDAVMSHGFLAPLSPVARQIQHAVQPALINAVVVAVANLSQVEREIFAADVVKLPDDRAAHDRPKRFEGKGTPACEPVAATMEFAAS